jgi:hypothetical protein
LAPGVDADALVRDAIDTTIAGIKAGAPSHARPSTDATAQLSGATAQRSDQALAAEHR